MSYHPNVSHLLNLFKFEHLPPHLQEVSRSFAELADEMARHFDGQGIELAAGLRKLLEAKDCMVRNALTSLD